MKEFRWLGSSYNDVCDFPDAARRDAGYQLHLIQSGLDPVDWKSMASVGQGVREIRLHQGGEHRIIYIAKSRLRDIEKLRSR